MKKTAMLSFIFLFFCTNSYALTTCDAILQNGIYDKNNQLSEKQKHETIKKSWCKTSERERGGGIGLKIKKIFSLNGKGKKSDINKFCQSNFKDISSDGKYIHISKEANSLIVNAWSQCINSRSAQVSHYLTPSHNPEKVIYGTIFRPDPNGGPRKVKLNYWAISGAKCPINFNKKYIDHNRFEVTCTRSPNSTVIVNAKSSSYGHNLRTVQLLPYQPPQINNATSYKNRIIQGKLFRVIFNKRCPKESSKYTGSNDPMGALLCGETYKVAYTQHNGEWIVTGFNESNQKIITNKHKNANPQKNMMSLWGRQYRFDEKGRVFDSQFGLVGQIIF